MQPSLSDFLQRHATLSFKKKMTYTMDFKKVFLSKGRDIFVVLLLLIITTAFYLPVFQNIDRAFSSVNWYEKYCFMASAKKAVLEYHQFPFRSPFIDGGYPTIGHPYDDAVNPLFIVVLIFGEIIGIRIIIFSIFILSVLGMFYLTRCVLNYNLPGAFFSAVTFILASHGACQFTQGHLEKLYLYLLPWLLTFFIKAKKDPRFIIAACLVLSMFLIKGIILFSVLLFLFLIACVYAIEIKGRKLRLNLSYILIFLIVVCLAFALCAPKILPAMELLSKNKAHFIHHPFENSYNKISNYVVERGRALSLRRLFDSLLVKGAYIVDGDDFSQMYLGYIPIALFFLSIFIFWRRIWRFLIVLAVFLVVASGSNSPIDLFKLLWHLNPLARFIWKLDDAFYIYIFFFVCIVSGMAFLLLDKIKKHRRLYAYAAFLLIFLSSYNMFVSNQRFLLHPDINFSKPQFGQIIPMSAPQQSFFQVKPYFPEKTKDDYFYIRQNIGITEFHQDLLVKIGSYAIPKYFVNNGDYEYIANPEGKLTLNPGYKGEVFFLEEENQAHMQYFSPDEIRVSVTVKKPGYLIINQNYHKSWRANLGCIIHYHGRLSVALKQTGEYVVILRYVPLGFYKGLIISLFAIACFWIIFKFSKKIKF